MSEVSKIEEIIKNKLEEETKRSTDQLVERIKSETKDAINRINGVYSSAINTLKKLELTDATIFEFFEKTQGNIRVVEIDNNWRSLLHVNVNGGTDVLSSNTIYLTEKTRYKIIVMAIEQPSGEVESEAEK